MSHLELVPVKFGMANSFVHARHRHSDTVDPRRHICSIGLADENGLRGVAIVTRPVARGLQDGRTAEVARLCTDGVKNGCSMLYGAAWRAARALGYRRLVTYTLARESGASLRASGWRCVAAVKGREWSCRSRPREEMGGAQCEPKLRWEQCACDTSPNRQRECHLTA